MRERGLTCLAGTGEVTVPLTRRRMMLETGTHSDSIQLAFYLTVVFL